MLHEELKLQYAHLRAQTASHERSSTPATARQLKPAERENTIAGTGNRAQIEVPQPAKRKRQVADGDDENQGDERGKQVGGTAKDGGAGGGNNEGSAIVSAELKRTMKLAVFISL